jgi:hypothetical protein
MRLSFCRHRSVHDHAVVHASRTVPRLDLQGGAAQAGPLRLKQPGWMQRDIAPAAARRGRRPHLARRRGPCGRAVPAAWRE